MSKSIFRVDENPDSITVVSNDLFSGISSVLSNYDERFGVHIESSEVKVFCISHFGDEENPFELTSDNVVFYRTKLVTRGLSDEEKSWCEDTLIESVAENPYL
jgi:hypothetical protein